MTFPQNQKKITKRFVKMLRSRTALTTLINGSLLLGGLLLQTAGQSGPAQWVYLAAALVGGAPIFRLALVNIVKRFDLTAGVMVSIAMIAALAIREYSAAALVAFMMLLGELLEELTAARADKALGELEELLPSRAVLRSKGRDRQIPLGEVRPGDCLLIRPGKAIPVDGKVLRGGAVVSQAAITGESLPVEKTQGAPVYAGTLCLEGSLEVKAERMGDGTMIGRMIHLVKEARKSRAPIQRTADRYAQYLIPLTLSIALLTRFLTGDLTRAITILIVVCPCSLVLATPTALFAAIGNAARRGILIKNGEAMEQIGRVDTIAFDKTGTLTLGKPELEEILPLKGFSRKELLTLAGGAERNSAHPLAEAILAKARGEGLQLPEPEAFENQNGYGVGARVAGRTVLLGEGMLRRRGVALPRELREQIAEASRRGATAVPLGVDGEAAGLLILRDTLRERVDQVIAELRRLAVPEILLISGDKKSAAQSLGDRLGISQVYGEVLPEEKLALIRRLQREGKQVAFVGDGINDAPALAAADVGIAMGTIGTHTAMETADIVLLTDRLEKLPALIVLSRRTLSTVRNNVIFSMGMNLLSLGLSTLGIIGPVAGAVMHEVSALPPVANSARLIGRKPKEDSADGTPTQTNPSRDQ